jgi:hypothetical protein
LLPVGWPIGKVGLSYRSVPVWNIIPVGFSVFPDGFWMSGKNYAMVVVFLKNK